MDGYVGQSIERMGRLVGVGVFIALILATLGIVGVVGEAVNRRTREIGVRVALGARAAQVTWAVSRESVITALAGLGGGLALLFVLREWMTTAVFDIYIGWLAPDVFSLRVLGLAAAVVMIATILATQISARRALRISPIEALRVE